MMSNSTSLRNKIIGYPQFEAMKRRLIDVYDDCQKSGLGKGITIVGPSGVGKTTLLKSFITDISVQKDNKKSRNTIIADVPAAPTPKSLASAILAGMSDPFAYSSRHSAEEKAGRIQKLMVELDTRVLILDEGQHLVERSKKGQYLTADWLKNLLNSTHVMVVIAGLPRLVDFLHTNEQLRRRFSSSHAYPAFDSSDAISMRNFVGVLHAIHNQLPVNCINISSADSAARFYFASFGLIDYVVKVIERAIVLAVESGSSEINMGTLAQAFRDEVWSSSPISRNPFDPSFDMRPLIFTGEPFDGYSWGKKSDE